MVYKGKLKFKGTIITSSGSWAKSLEVGRVAVGSVVLALFVLGLMLVVEFVGTLRLPVAGGTGGCLVAGTVLKTPLVFEEESSSNFDDDDDADGGGGEGTGLVCVLFV